MKSINWLIITAFLFTSIVGPAPEVRAQTSIILPMPGIMVNLSRPYTPLQLRGIEVYSKSPLRFDFLIDKGESGLRGPALNDEVARMTKYFLTCLTVPETDVWVNLSPYEKNRIAPENFGITQMGKDLLEQDYLLKQITASLSYPDRDLGRRFWLKMYEKAYKLYGTTDVPVNTFNKVWIVPKSADVYVHGTSAFVAHSELDVMLDTDYLALRQSLDNTALGLNRVRNQDYNQYAQIYTQAVREVILPVLRKEVNTGKNFAVVRQVFQAMILAAWYKRHLKNSLLGKMYVGKNKVAGVDVDDKNVKEEIFRQYLRAFKKKVYNYIKEDYDPLTQETVPRKYVSGGFNGDFGQLADTRLKEDAGRDEALVALGPDLVEATIDVSPIPEGQEADQLKAFNGLLDSIINGKLKLSDKEGRVFGEVANSVLTLMQTGRGNIVSKYIHAYQIQLERSIRLNTTFSNHPQGNNLLHQPSSVDIVSGKIRGETYTGNQRRRMADLLDIMKAVYFAEDPLSANEAFGFLPFRIRSSKGLDHVPTDIARRMGYSLDAIEAIRQRSSWPEDSTLGTRKNVDVLIVDQISKKNPEIALRYNAEDERIEIGANALEMNPYKFSRLLQKAYTEALVDRMAKSLAARLGLDEAAHQEMKDTIALIAAKGTSLSQFIMYCNISAGDRFTFENVSRFLGLVLDGRTLNDNELAGFTGQNRERIDVLIAERKETAHRTPGRFERFMDFMIAHPLVTAIPLAFFLALSGGMAHAAGSHHDGGGLGPGFDSGGDLNPGIDLNLGGVEFPQAFVLPPHPLGLGSQGPAVTEIGSALNVSADDVRNLAGQSNPLSHLKNKAYDSDYLTKHADAIVQGAQKDIQHGSFSQNVRNVVIAFQHKHHLPETGKIDKWVIDQLNLLNGSSISAGGHGSGAGGPSGGGPPESSDAPPALTSQLQAAASNPYVLPAWMQPTTPPLGPTIGPHQAASIIVHNVDTTQESAGKVDEDREKEANAASGFSVQAGVQGFYETGYHVWGPSVQINVPGYNPLGKTQALQAVINKMLAQANNDATKLDKVFEMFGVFMKYHDLKANHLRLQIKNPVGLDLELSRADDLELQKLAEITILLQMNDLSPEILVALMDMGVDLYEIERDLKDNGPLLDAQYQPLARKAALTLSLALEQVHGALGVDQRSFLTRLLPASGVFNISFLHAPGNLLRYFLPTWKTYSAFDEKQQIAVIRGAGQDWWNARSDWLGNCQQILEDLNGKVDELNQALKDWETIPAQEETVKLSKAYTNISNLLQEVSELQLKALKAGFTAAEIMQIGQKSKEQRIGLAQSHVQAVFALVAQDLQKQIDELIRQLEKGKHKNEDKVKHILAQVQYVKNLMDKPIGETAEEAFGSPDDPMGGLSSSMPTSGLSGVLPLPGAGLTTEPGASTANPSGWSIHQGTQPTIGTTPAVALKGKSARPKLIEKETLSVFDSIRGTKLDPNFKGKGAYWVQDPKNPTKVRLSTDADLSDDVIQGMAKGDTDKFWPVLEGCMSSNQKLDTYGKQYNDAFGKKDIFRMATLSIKIAATMVQVINEQGPSVGGTAVYQQVFPNQARQGVVALQKVGSFTPDPIHLATQGISRLLGKKSDDQTPLLIMAGAINKKAGLSGVTSVVQAKAEGPGGANYKKFDQFYAMKLEDIDVSLRPFYTATKDIWNGVAEAPSIDTGKAAIDVETAEKMLKFGPMYFTWWSSHYALYYADAKTSIFANGIWGYVGFDRSSKPRDRQLKQRLLIGLRQTLANLTDTDKRAINDAQSKLAAAGILGNIIDNRQQGSMSVVGAISRKGLAQIIADNQLMRRQRQEAEKIKKDPRAVAFNLWGFVHKPLAGGAWYTAYVTIFDGGLHHLLNKEAVDFLADYDHQAGLQSKAAAERVMELFRQQDFAKDFLNKVDTEFKNALEHLKQMEDLHRQGLYSDDELAKAKQAYERLLGLESSALDQLTRASIGLHYELTLAGFTTPEQLKALGVEDRPWTLSPMSNTDFFPQDTDLTARELSIQFIGSLDMLGPLRDALTNAKLTPQQLGSLISAVYQVGGGDIPGLDSEAKRLESLLHILPTAVNYIGIETGSIPLDVQPPPPLNVQSPSPESAPKASSALPPWADLNVKGPALRVAVANELLQLCLKTPDLLFPNNPNPDVDDVIAYLKSKYGNDDARLRSVIPYVTGKITEIKKGDVASSEKSSKAQLAAIPLAKNGGVDMNSGLLDLKEHNDGFNASVFDEKALELTPIDGISLRVLQMVPVTPMMLKALLG